MEFDVKFGIITLNSIVFQKRHFVLGHPILAGWITLVREREKEKQEKKSLQLTQVNGGGVDQMKYCIS